MTIKEWQEYECDLPIPQGWQDHVRELIDEIAKIDDTIEVMQIKEKFGSLRFYILSGTDEIFDLIDEYERKTEEMCENDGYTAKTRKYGYWLKTLCDSCHKEYCNNNNISFTEEI